MPTRVVAGWLLGITTRDVGTWSAAAVLSGYRARWHVERVLKKMQQRLRRNQRRSQHRPSVEATGRALLVAWALHAGTTSLLRTLVSAPAPTETVVSRWRVSGGGSTQCGSRCRAGGRRPASRWASRVCAAFCGAGRGVEGIRKALGGRGWHNERAPASAVSNKWHKGYAGGGAVSTRKWSLPPCPHILASRLLPLSGCLSTGIPPWGSTINSNLPWFRSGR